MLLFLGPEDFGPPKSSLPLQHMSQHQHTKSPQIEDLRRLFDPSLPHPSPFPSLLSPIPSHFLLAHPTLLESNALIKHFFESVHPFTRIIHQTLFTKELGQYRRGTFGLALEFEALLFCIYLVTVNTLSGSIVQDIFGALKGEVLERFEGSAKAALGGIGFWRTEKVHGLDALLHYVVFTISFLIFLLWALVFSLKLRRANTPRPTYSNKTSTTTPPPSSLYPPPSQKPWASTATPHTSPTPHGYATSVVESTTTSPVSTATPSPPTAPSLASPQKPTPNHLKTPTTEIGTPAASPNLPIHHKTRRE